MYAALVRLTIDPARAAEAAAMFTREILPRVKASTGFQAGYWLEPVDGEGFGFVLFDTAEHARQAVLPTDAWSAPGVTIHGVDIRKTAVAI